MTRRILHLAAAAAAFAAAHPAFAQPAVELIPPPPPGVFDRPEGEVSPPEEPGADGPIAEAVGTGPSFTLRNVSLRGATAIPEAELAPIWAELIGTPVTLATLEDIAARIGARYRARGFVLSQALLPAQTIDQGDVEIVVVEGFVDRIEITGGAANQQALASRLFAPVAAERPAALPTLERAVLLSRDTFGPAVETVLEPSPDVFAAADLGVLITPDPFTGFAAVDNRGSRLYGTWTLSAGGSSYNLLGLNERLDALVVAAPGDGSLAFGGAVFDAPLEPLIGTWLDGGRLEVSGNYSHADPDLAKSGYQQDLTVTTRETDLSAGLIVPFVRTRSQNLFGRLALGWRDSTSDTAFTGTSDTSSTDRLSILEARLTWDIADRFGGVNLVDASLKQGLDILGARIGDPGPASGSTDFTYGSLVLSRLQQIGDGEWSVFGEAIGQYAANVLPNTERFGLGVSTIGRGFAPGNTTGDSGYGLRLELRREFGPEVMGNTGLSAAQGYVFADYGQAYDRTGERDGEQWEPLGSVGIGARIDIRPWLSITPEIVRQTEGVATDTTRSGLETRGFIGVVARF